MGRCLFSRGVRNSRGRPSASAEEPEPCSGPLVEIIATDEAEDCVR
jgi:hypothetical protein